MIKKTIEELALDYFQTKEESIKLRICEIKINKWERIYSKVAQSLMTTEDEVRALYEDTLLDVIDKFDGKSKFLNFLNFALKKKRARMYRDNKRRRKTELYVIDKADNFEEGAPTPEVADDYNLEEHTIKEIYKKKEADKRQLIDFLLSEHQAAKPDDVLTTDIVSTILKDRSLSKKVNYTALAKTLDTYDRNVERSIRKLSTYYDANRFGDICDYLAV